MQKMQKFSEKKIVCVRVSVYAGVRTDKKNNVCQGSHFCSKYLQIKDTCSC